jgi:hypothetical protein
VVCPVSERSVGYLQTAYKKCGFRLGNLPSSLCGSKTATVGWQWFPSNPVKSTLSTEIFLFSADASYIVPTKSIPIIEKANEINVLGMYFNVVYH